MARTNVLLLSLLLCAIVVSCDDEGGTGTDTGTTPDVGDTHTQDVPADVVDTTTPDTVPDTAVDTFVPDTAQDLADTSVTDTVEDLVLDTIEDANDAHDGMDGVDPCEQVLGPANRVRKVVVAKPNKADGDHKSNLFEVLELDTAGNLSLTGTTFEMGRATYHNIEFTPNGRIGLVAQEGGTVGVFRFDDNGDPVVVHAGYDQVYTGKIVIHDSGEFVYLVNEGWVEHGGGIYQVPMDCDGTLGTPTLIQESKLTVGVVPIPGTSRFVMASREFPGLSTLGEDTHLVSIDGTFSYLDGADGFGDHDPSPWTAALTQDSRFALVAENGMFDTPHTVAVVEVLDDGLREAQVFGSYADPSCIVTSPHNNAALVGVFQDDAVYRLSYDPNEPTRPFGQLDSFGSSQPNAAAQVTRGQLSGRVLITQTSDIRQLHFEADGSVTDLGAFDVTGESYEGMTGAIGIQP